jgi:hypothetical protein
MVPRLRGRAAEGRSITAKARPTSRHYKRPLAALGRCRKSRKAQL